METRVRRLSIRWIYYKTRRNTKITILLPKYNRVDPSGFNFVPVKQGSKQWHPFRIGIIAAGKIP